MTKSQALLRSICGAVRSDLRPLAAAIDVAAELMFVHNQAMDDIVLSRDVLPAARQRMAEDGHSIPSLSAMARQVERTANLCWQHLQERGLLDRCIGDASLRQPAPRDLVFYLAYYLHHDAPFFKLINRQPMMLFHPADVEP